MKTILIHSDNSGSEAAKIAIEQLQNQGNKVIIINNEDMNKQHLQSLLGLAMFAESIQNEYPHISTNQKLKAKDIDLIHGSEIRKIKSIPKGCKIWNIGKYEVIALNRKNAIRKALNLRKRDFHCA